MRYSPTADWLARKLGLNPEDLDIFITADSNRYFGRPVEERMELANIVEYFHKPTKQIILFGPKDINSGDKIIVGMGYESREFQDFVESKKDLIRKPL